MKFCWYICLFFPLVAICTACICRRYIGAWNPVAGGLFISQVPFEAEALLEDMLVDPGVVTLRYIHGPVRAEAVDEDDLVDPRERVEARLYPLLQDLALHFQ